MNKLNAHTHHASSAHTNKMPGSQLLPMEPDSDTESVDLAGGQEGRLELREDVDSPMTAAKSSQPPSSGGKLASFCSTLRKTWFVKEFVMMFKLSVPLFLLNFFQQVSNFIALLFVGQFYTATELTAVALGVAFYNVTGFSVLIGLATAADTLCPQSYGYKNYKRVGVIVQRGVLILSLSCLPIAALWLNTESILLLLKQQPCVVRLTGTYLRVVIMTLPSIVVYTMIQKYLQAQSLVWVFVLSGMMVNIALVACCGIFIVAADLGVIGAALSIVLASTVAPIFMVVYIKWRKLHHKTWGGWGFDSLTEWWQFLRLGLPGFLMLAFEWWSFEISAIVVGTIDETQLAIHAVLIQYGTMFFMIPYSIGTAVNIRVGNELGAGNPVSARRVSFVGVCLAVAVGLLIIFFMLAFRRDLARIFTSHQEVIDGTGDALLYGAIYVFFLDQVQGVISSIMRATGRQAYAAVTNFVCYYLIGLPLGITLALVVGLQTKGMWIGLSVADGIQTTVLSILFFTTNWKKQCDKAMSDAAIGDDRKDKDSDSVSTVEESVSDGTHDSGIELKEITDHRSEKEEEEEEGSLEGEDLLVSYKDSEKLVSQDSPPGVWNRILYSNSSKCCRTKASIVISKGMFLIVGVAVLLVGAVLAGTIRHHPTDDDQCSNTSLVSTDFSDFPTPTRTSDELSSVRPTHTRSRYEADPTPDPSTIDEGSDATPTPVPTPYPGSTIGTTSRHRSRDSTPITPSPAHWEVATQQIHLVATPSPVS